MPATITLNYAFLCGGVMKAEITIQVKEEWEHPESLLGLLESLSLKGFITYKVDNGPEM